MLGGRNLFLITTKICGWDIAREKIERFFFFLLWKKTRVELSFAGSLLLEGEKAIAVCGLTKIAKLYKRVPDLHHYLTHNEKENTITSNRSTTRTKSNEKKLSMSTKSDNNSYENKYFHSFISEMCPTPNDKRANIIWKSFQLVISSWGYICDCLPFD